jgi:hypothetical protein
VVPQQVVELFTKSVSRVEKRRRGEGKEESGEGERLFSIQCLFTLLSTVYLLSIYCLFTVYSVLSRPHTIDITVHLFSTQRIHTSASRFIHPLFILYASSIHPLFVMMNRDQLEDSTISIFIAVHQFNHHVIALYSSSVLITVFHILPRVRFLSDYSKSIRLWICPHQLFVHCNGKFRSSIYQKGHPERLCAHSKHHCCLTASSFPRCFLLPYSFLTQAWA